VNATSHWAGLHYGVVNPARPLGSSETSGVRGLRVVLGALYARSAAAWAFKSANDYSRMARDTLGSAFHRRRILEQWSQLTTPG
jgi:hypothetical protein